MPAPPAALPPATASASTRSPTSARSASPARSNTLARFGNGWLVRVAFPGESERVFVADFRAGEARALDPVDARPLRIGSVIDEPLATRFAIDGGAAPLEFTIPFQGYADLVHAGALRGEQRGTATLSRGGPIGALWIGGFAVDGEPSAGRLLEIDFDAQRAKLSIDGDWFPLQLTLLDPRHARFSIDPEPGKTPPYVFECEVARSGALHGEVTHANARGTFDLTWARPHDREAMRHYEGTYRTSDGRTLRVSASAMLARLFDASDGRTRRLVAIDGDRFLVGPTLGGSYPWTGALEFKFDAAGQANRLIWRENDGKTIDAERVVYPEHELRFTSGDATLSGTLYLPSSRGPFPAVVRVHGSGREARDNSWDQSMARVFLDEGIAVFLYDKRGVGASGGEYVPGAREGNNTSPANVERLAADARAAAAAIARRPDIVREKVGLFGISQAGWIIPLAASSSKDIRFVVVASGPTVPTSLEALHSDLMADGAQGTSYSLEQADVLVQKAPRTGFDPAPAIEALRVPGLWIYGALDTSIPVPECLRTLERIRALRPGDLEVVTIPAAGHSLYEVPRDLEAEVLFSPGFANGVIPKIRAWLRARGLASAPGGANTSLHRKAR